MNLPIALIRRLASGSIAVVLAGLIATISLVVAVIGLVNQIDMNQMAVALGNVRSETTRVLVGLLGFSGAFCFRSLIWVRVLPGLTLGQSWAGIHLALGANHVLPFRLGEPLRAVSVIRRGRIPAGDVLATSVALRTSDILSLLLLAAFLAPSAMVEIMGLWGVALVLLGLGAVAVLAHQAIKRGIVWRSFVPAPTVFAATGSAWLLEAILVWQVAAVVGVSLSYRDAVLVTTVAVSAQLVAIAPGGLGTYEAAATTALVLVGTDPKSALTIAVLTHLLKTLYSILTGTIAMTFPRPGIFGRLRVPQSIPKPRRDQLDASPTASDLLRPVVLFLPAYQEGPRIAEVLARVPEISHGRPVVSLVIDDGSTDDTVERATSAGASVVSLPTNRGLGAAVAEGFRRSVADYDAEVVVFCDADGEYDPAAIDDLVAPILEGTADYVVGSRFAGEIEHMRPHRRIGNLTLTYWVRWMTRTNVSDGQSGYRALSRNAAESVKIAHDYNYAQVLTIDLIQKGFRYHEVPISYHFRETGDSFIKLGTYLRAVVPAVWRLLNPREGQSSTM